MINRNHRSIRRAAFSLMEVLVVVAIIVIVALSGGVIYTKYLDDAKQDRARMDVEKLSMVVETFYARHSAYPTSFQDLLMPEADGGKPFLEDSALKDPWNRPYQYANPGQRNALYGKPDIWSDGPRYGDPNGVIGNWPLSAGQGGRP